MNWHTYVALCHALQRRLIWCISGGGGASMPIEYICLWCRERTENTVTALNWSGSKFPAYLPYSLQLVLQLHQACNLNSIILILMDSPQILASTVHQMAPFKVLIINNFLERGSPVARPHFTIKVFFFLFLCFVSFFSLYFDLFTARCGIQTWESTRGIRIESTWTSEVESDSSATAAVMAHDGPGVIQYHVWRIGLSGIRKKKNKKASGAQCFIMAVGLFWDIVTDLLWAPNGVGSLEPKRCCVFLPGAH